MRKIIFANFFNDRVIAVESNTGIEMSVGIIKLLRIED